MIKVDLNVDLRKIPALTFPELKEYYEALFNIPTTSTRKEYYVWRITNKLQEMRFGGLDIFLLSFINIRLFNYF